MTMIANYPTKKAFKEAVAAKPAEVLIEDPALMVEGRKYGASFTPAELPQGAVVVVTNHPKRSWFAELKVTASGIKVS